MSKLKEMLKSNRKSLFNSNLNLETLEKLKLKLSKKDPIVLGSTKEPADFGSVGADVTSWDTILKKPTD